MKHDPRLAKLLKQAEARINFPGGAGRTITVDGNPVNEASGPPAPPVGAPGDNGTIISLNLTADRTTGFGTMIVRCRAAMSSTAEQWNGGIAHNEIEGTWSCPTALPHTALPAEFDGIWGTANGTKGYGAQSAFILPPGTHTITFDGTDGVSNRLADNTLTITVLDRAAVFDGDNGEDTVVVSQVSNWDGAPPNAARVTSIAAAEAHLAGRQNQCMMLRHDEEFTQGGITLAETSGANRNCLVTRYGGTGKPLVNMTSQANRESNGFALRGNTWDQCTVEHLRIRGPFDATSEVSLRPELVGVEEAALTAEPGGVGMTFDAGGSNKPIDAYKVVYDCEIEGCKIGIAFSSLGNPFTFNRTMYVGNCFITDWIQNGLFSAAIDTGALVGNVIAARPGSINSTSGVFMQSSPLRLSELKNFHLWNNYLAIFSHNFANDGNRIQSALIRIHDGGASPNPPLVDAEISVGCLLGEGGALQFYNTRTGWYGPSDNFIIGDRILCLNTDRFQYLFECPHGGFTLRNAAFFATNVAPGASSGTTRMVETQNALFVPTRPQQIYSSAFFDDADDTNATNRGGTPLPFLFITSEDLNGAPAGSYFGNNILQTRNRSSAAPDSGPVDTTPRFPLRWTGEKWRLDDASGFEEPANRQYQSASNIVPRPFAAHSAVNDGDQNERFARLDWDGNYSDGRHRGPWQTLAA